MRSELKMILVVVICFMILFVICIISSLNSAVAWNPKNIVESEGKIVDVINNVYVLQYSANGKDYYISKSDFEDNKIGDKIDIVYNKNNPEKVELASRKSAFITVIVVIVVALILPFGILLKIFNSYNKLQKKGQKEVAKLASVGFTDNNSVVYGFNIEKDNKIIFMQDPFNASYYKAVLEDCDIKEVNCYFKSLRKKICRADFEGTLAEKNIVVSYTRRVV